MSELSFREARREDLPAIIAMLADDGLGGTRETPLPEGVDPVYETAFDELATQSGNRLIVAERDGALVGTMQLVIIPGLSRHGARRAQIEAVRVARPVRGQGIGDALLRHAIDEARAAGCALVQLTSDKRRGRAHIFYERVGFVATHVGFKMALK
jgi:GNAT superfamily N-acetyltransferase